MNDTPADVAAEFEALMARRSGSERVRMACEMFDLARALAIAGIRTSNPDVSEECLRRQLFERLYGGDFTDDERTRLLALLR